LASASRPPLNSVVRRSQGKNAVQQIYQDLRSQVLSITAEQLGTSTGTFGVLMETGYPEAVVTLVALSDGTASLYFSNGGGIIGAGAHEGPRVAAQSLISFAAHNRHHLAPTTQTPVPSPGRTRFYVLTTDGLLTAEAPEDDLGENRHALSPLFHSAHALISEMHDSDAVLGA
jgi:hypothetical protein